MMGILARRFWMTKNRSQLTAPMQSIDITMALFQGHIDPPELMGSYASRQPRSYQPSC
jgi:hypothetical protein